MHPPATQTNRKCLEDYKIPGQDVIIEKGTTVIIPIMGIHYDKEYYPEPEKFDPERFTDENKRLRHNFAHIPFGEGPRNCIGMRFGLLQSKMGLVSLLKNYNFTVNKKTMEPLQYKPNHFVLAAQGDIWLNAEKIENI
jgi:cytochrome P450 family 6